MVLHHWETSQVTEEKIADGSCGYLKFLLHRISMVLVKYLYSEKCSHTIGENAMTLRRRCKTLDFQSCLLNFSVVLYLDQLVPRLLQVFSIGRRIEWKIFLAICKLRTNASYKILLPKKTLSFIANRGFGLF